MKTRFLIFLAVLVAFGCLLFLTGSVKADDASPSPFRYVQFGRVGQRVYIYAVQHTPTGHCFIIVEPDSTSRGLSIIQTSDDVCTKNVEQ